MNIRIRRRAGFTLIEIMIVVAIIGLLAAIAIPNFIRARITTQKNACINNLRQIDAAKQQWALEFNQSSQATPLTTSLRVYLGRGGGFDPTCPAAGIGSTFAGSYTVGKMNEIPLCKIDPANHQFPL